MNASGPLADILRKACAPAPADRFASPTEMRLALEAVLRGASDAAPVPEAGDATVRAAAPAAEVPAADAAATVAAAPKAPETPDAADETTRLPFGQQPAAQPTAPAKAPAPKAEDETVFLFAQQEQQRREAEAAARKAEEDARRAEQQRKAEEARAAAAKEQAQRAEQERKAREAEEAARKAEQEKAEAAETPAPAGEKKISRRKMLGVIGGAAALALVGGAGYAVYSAESSKPVAEGSCGDGLTWSISGAGVLTIQGSGTITGTPWEKLADRVTAIDLQASVPTIPPYCFTRFTSLTSVTLPEGLQIFGSYSFYCCVSLTTVTIPDGVFYIGNRAFGNCSSLSSVSIPESVTSIRNGAFSGCALTSVTVSRNCKVHESAFDEGVTINYYD